MEILCEKKNQNNKQDVWQTWTLSFGEWNLTESNKGKQNISLTIKMASIDFVIFYAA